jgi:uncharacterized protein (DUF2236 family)
MRRLYKVDPMTPRERNDFEEYLNAYCDNELDLI